MQITPSSKGNSRPKRKAGSEGAEVPDVTVLNERSSRRAVQRTLDAMLKVPSSDDSGDESEENLEREVRPHRIISLDRDPVLAEIKELYQPVTSHRYSLRGH